MTKDWNYVCRFADKIRFRISAQVYNELEDYEKLCRALKEEFVG